jgi:hypothetical protein
VEGRLRTGEVGEKGGGRRGVDLWDLIWLKGEPLMREILVRLGIFYK